jgi:hypothetical protein
MARAQALVRQRLDNGLKMSAAISTTSVFPLSSSQCVTSFPTDSISLLEWSFDAPPSRCSVRVPSRTYATAGRSLCEWIPMMPFGSQLENPQHRCPHRPRHLDEPRPELLDLKVGIGQSLTQIVSVLLQPVNVCPIPVHMPSHRLSARHLGQAGCSSWQEPSAA